MVPDPKPSGPSRNFLRDQAINAIAQVIQDHKPLDVALERALSPTASAQDRAWVQDLCSGTLRAWGRIQILFSKLSERKKPSGRLGRALSVAAYQLLYQDRAPAAKVVSETVDLVRRNDGKAPAGFANALLRRLAREKDQWLRMDWDDLGSVAPALSETQAEWAGLQGWVWKSCLKRFGEAEARAFADACMSRPDLWLRSSPDAAWTAQTRPELQPGPIERSWKDLAGGRVESKPGFATGEFIVQDVSNQILVDGVARQVREAMGAMGERPARPRMLDLCAAPGGKAIAMAWEGFSVDATERSEGRGRLLASSLERVKPPGVRVLPFDAAIAGGELYDLVWVDAPCSSTGLVRRHPDQRWLCRESEVSGLTRVQDELIQMAARKVKPGGFLAYSVCSMLAEEGPDRLAAASLAMREPMLEVARWELWPHHAPFGDGLWCALLQSPSAT